MQFTLISRKLEMNKSDARNLVPFSYWRAALAEISLYHPEIPADDKPFEIIRQGENLQITNTTPQDFQSWVASQFDASKAASDLSDGKTVRTIPYLLIPARLSTLSSHSVKFDGEDVNAGLTLLCIPCLLDRQGRLLPDPDRQPWIPRDLLSPSLKSITIGDLDNQDHFLSTIPGKPTSLEDVFETAARLFEEVTGTALPLLAEYIFNDHPIPPVFEREGFEVVSEWHGLPYNPPIIARHLIKLYDHLSAQSPDTPTLNNLRDTSDRVARDPISIAEAEPYYSSTIGHINNKHPLSQSQREALTELVAMQRGEILTVNGPPGTGKTTLLQSVIAQLWVDAALKRTDCPLILVASTNVKAVENVLHCFGELGADIGHKRWLPYSGGFGLFMASATRQTKFPVCTGDTHPFIEYETVDAIAAARTIYLDHANAYFQSKHDSVEAVIDALHEELKLSHKNLKKIIRARYAIFEATGADATGNAMSLCEKYSAEYERQAIEARADFDGANATISRCKEIIQSNEISYKNVLAKIDAAEQRWAEYLSTSPLWLDFLSFLPPILKRRNARDRAFLLADPLTATLNNRQSDLTEHFCSLRNTALSDYQGDVTSVLLELATSEDQKRKASARLRVATEGVIALRTLVRNWIDALGEKLKHLSNTSLAALSDELDVLIRAPMFCTADHYWSGQWLVEMQARLGSQTTDTKGCAKLEAKYRRFAKLSPCLVSNFHMAPSFFTAWQGEELPLWNVIDLLVVDEAGQVAPDIGAGMFGLAKRALVVGDIHQIEPVWNIGETTDRANAVKFNLTSHNRDPRYEILANVGYTSAKGSLIKIAGRSCTVQKHDDVRGLLLTEHRRCVPELVSYCNALVYGGRLEPLRPAISPQDRLYPAYMTVDIKSADKIVGTSRQNYKEAEAIVKWLAENRHHIENHYRDPKTNDRVPLWKSVGVVTPFSTQANLIERLLRKTMPDLMRKDTRLTVGTVHALQGAEREIVIFSPTYGHQHNGTKFFDRSPNMLNVAVSRAKDSFIVIGNAHLFDPSKKSIPSGLLGAFLFGSHSI